MEWSSEQNEIFKHAIDTNDSIVVNAVAGSGKTTTIVEIANRLPNTGVFLAFNKAIAEELAKRLPPTYRASTFHSLGLGILKGKNKKIKVTPNKIKDLIAEEDEIDRKLRYPIQLIVSFAKSLGVGIFGDFNNRDEWLAVIDNCTMADIPSTTNIDTVIDAATRILIKSNEEQDEIDFDDMIYLPLLYKKEGNIIFEQYDCVIVDEAQDTNAMQIEFLKNITKRIIAVGDRNQAIYGFRGADYAAFDSIAIHYNAVELPLTISYRCGKNIIEEAKQYVPHITACESAEDGSVNTLTMSEFNELLDNLSDDSAVICRANAPLITLAVRRLRQRKPFNITSDFTKKLTSYINSSKTDDLSIFIADLTKRHDTIVTSYESRKLYVRANLEREKFAALKYLASETSSVTELTDLINALINSKSGVTLSTIHKSKGMEYDNVYFYQRNICPARFVLASGNEMAIQQEDNLIYVGITRAKKSLSYIYSC